MPLSNILVTFLLASFVNQSVGVDYCVCDAGKDVNTYRYFLFGEMPCSNPGVAACSATDYANAFKSACCVPNYCKCDAGKNVVSGLYFESSSSGQWYDCSYPTVAYCAEMSYANDFKNGCCVAAPIAPPAASPTAPPAGASNAASDWYLELDGVVTWSVATFNSDGNLAITQKYKVAKEKAYTVTFFKSDCITSTTIPSYTPADPVAHPSDTLYNSLTVTSTIGETSVVNSPIWTKAADGTQASINFCVRVDLVDGSATPTSYNFHEQKLLVTIDLSQGFTVTGVDVNRQDADTGSTNTNSAVALIACKCNANAVCDTFATALVQGDAMFICIKPPAESTNIKVAKVTSMSYTQGTGSNLLTKIPIPIASGTPDGVTSVQVTTDQAGQVVKTQLPSELFSPSRVNDNLAVSGTALINFVSGRARLLRFVIDNSVDHMGGSAVSRKMQDQTNETQGEFSLSVDLAAREMEEAPQADSNTGVIIGGIVGLIAGVAIIVALVVAARRKKDDDDDDKKKKEAASVSKGVSVPEVD
jgi:hypothetical protein